MRAFAIFVLVALVCGLAVAHSESAFAPNDVAVAAPQTEQANPSAEITPANNDATENAQAENEENMKPDESDKVENEEEQDKAEEEDEQYMEQDKIDEENEKIEDENDAELAKGEAEDAKEDMEEEQEAKAEAEEAFDFADDAQHAEQMAQDKTLEQEESPMFAEIESEDLLSNELYDEEADEEEEQDDEELSDRVDDETGHVTAADDTDNHFRFAEVRDTPAPAATNTLNPTPVPTVTDPNASNGVTMLKANSGDAAGNANKGVTILSKDGVGNSTACACVGRPQCACAGVGAGIHTEANNPEGIRIIKANVEPPKDPAKLTVIPKTSNTVVEP